MIDGYTPWNGARAAAFAGVLVVIIAPVTGLVIEPPRINSLHTELFAYLLQKLKSTADGDGTLLDHSMLVYGSGLADGNKHIHEGLPVLLAGRGGGSLKPGRHLTYSAGTPITNLYLWLLDRMGVHQGSIGDSTGQLNQLDGL